MAFQAAELTSIANAALDYYFDRGKLYLQDIQAKPLLDCIWGKKKTFPGGKGNISVGIKGDHGTDASGGGGSDTVTGYTHDDTVTFYTPANIKRANYPWREHHLGLQITHTELKIDGISVVDTNGAKTATHSRAEETRLASLLEDKLEDLTVQWQRGMNNLLWDDGTTDAAALAGIQALVTDNPTAGVVGGIDRATAVFWRNRAATAAHGVAGGQGVITSAAANGGALLTFLQNEWRQLRRYGGKIDKILAGSDFIQAMETEIRANGNYSLTGFTGKQDGAMGEMEFKGVKVMYDPSLDDLSLSKRAYFIDSRRIFLDMIEGETMHHHTPSRPAEKFVLYRSITNTGQLVMTQANCHGVYDIA